MNQGVIPPSAGGSVQVLSKRRRVHPSYRRYNREDKPSKVCGCHNQLLLSHRYRWIPKAWQTGWSVRLTESQSDRLRADRNTFLCGCGQNFSHLSFVPKRSVPLSAWSSLPYRQSPRYFLRRHYRQWRVCQRS